MDEQGGIEPTPELDDFFVLGAQHREMSHEERERQAELERARERSERYRSELQRGREEAQRSRRRTRRRIPGRRPSSPSDAPSRARQALSIVLVLAVVAAAIYFTRHSPSSGTGLASVPRPGPCPTALYPAGSEYRFESCAGVQPLSWGRCRTLTVSTDSTNAPPAWQDDVNNSLSQLAAATGLQFKTTAQGADIAISWSAVLDLPGVEGADKAGVTDVRTESSSSGARIVSARIQISTRLDPGTGPEGEVPVILHELGHAVGLGHYPGTVVMNPVDQGYPEYRSGDIAGLAVLYSPDTCS